MDKLECRLDVFQPIYVISKDDMAGHGETAGIIIAFKQVQMSRVPSSDSLNYWHYPSLKRNSTSQERGRI